ncbi:hypothetical protein chiPu_0017968 [Chiloscyllium punctatum]|uniref:TIR domain-containing protein n=1 Tax=Chiloscyllium punctatum TaxID=137246 RepID=A0A401RK54_CHIPU|nr:hypothetical protein [Chiloscyllium punctatum]
MLKVEAFLCSFILLELFYQSRGVVITSSNKEVETDEHKLMNLLSNMKSVVIILSDVRLEHLYEILYTLLRRGIKLFGFDYRRDKEIVYHE